MPYSSVAELKASPLYARMDALKTLSERQLERFVSIFNAVLKRSTENGGDSSGAESTAVAIALSTARRAGLTQRPLEKAVHFFAAMAPQQFAGGTGGITGRVLDFSWIKKHPDLASHIAAGNEFNFDHDKANGVGVIRGLILRDEAPEHVRAKTHEDIPFLFVASYYEDAKPEVKALDTISAEWAVLHEEDGIEVPIPHSFAITPIPLNDPMLGIKRIASWTPATNEELASFEASLTRERETPPLPETTKAGAGPSKGPRTTMPKSVEELQNEVASLQSERTSEKKTLRERVASLRQTVTTTPGLEPLKEAIASLPADADPLVVLDTVAASLKIAGVQRSELATQVTGLTEQVASLKKNAAEKEANEFAAGLLTEGKIASDRVPAWSQRFLKDREAALDAAKDLTPKHPIGPGKAKGIGGIEESEASLIMAEIDERAVIKTKGGGA